MNYELPVSMPHDLSHRVRVHALFIFSLRIQNYYFLLESSPLAFKLLWENTDTILTQKCTKVTFQQSKLKTWKSLLSKKRDQTANYYTTMVTLTTVEWSKIYSRYWADPKIVWFFLKSNFYVSIAEIKTVVQYKNHIFLYICCINTNFEQYWVSTIYFLGDINETFFIFVEKYPKIKYTINGHLHVKHLLNYCTEWIVLKLEISHCWNN
jgi:hypothetical protein